MNYEQAISYFEKLRNTSASEIIFESFYWAFLTAFGVFSFLILFTFISLCILFVRSIKTGWNPILADDNEIGFNIRYFKSFFCGLSKDPDLIKIFALAILACFIVVFVITLIRKSFDLPISKRDIINSPYYQTLNNTQKEYIKYRYFILNDEPDDSKVIIQLEQFKDTIKVIDKLKDK